MPALRDQLQRTLSEQYVLDREIGRGGSNRLPGSRHAPRPPLALKVLDPELGAVLGAEFPARELPVPHDGTAGFRHYPRRIPNWLTELRRLTRGSP